MSNVLPAGRRSLNFVFETLYSEFPLCFGKIRRVPLKIGIFEDVREALRARKKTIPKKLLNAAIKKYVSSWSYLASCVAEGAVRIDLLGNPCGVVNARCAAYAAGCLAGRLKKVYLGNFDSADLRKVEKLFKQYPDADRLLGDKVRMWILNGLSKAGRLPQNH